MLSPSRAVHALAASFILLAASGIAAQGPASAHGPAVHAATDVTESHAASGDSLGLSVFAAPYKSARAGASVLIGVEIRGLSGEDPRTRRLDVRVEAPNAVWSSALPLADVPAELVPQGVRVLTRLQLPPGRHPLRVIAREVVSGQSGAVTHSVDVPDLTSTSVQIAASGLVLASSNNDAYTWVDEAEEHRVLPILLQPPTARRVFSAPERVEVFAEFYDVPADVDDGLLSLVIVTRVRAADGAIAYTTEDLGASEILMSGHYGYAHSALVPIADLRPGRYTLEVDVRVSGSNSSVLRAVPFSVADAGRLP